jgi:DnaJ-class molecular chaperone
MPEPKWPQMEACSWCWGYGIHYSGEDIVECRVCGGGGMVEKRDERGRFLPWRTVQAITHHGERGTRDP